MAQFNGVRVGIVVVSPFRLLTVAAIRRRKPKKSALAGRRRIEHLSFGLAPSATTDLPSLCAMAMVATALEALTGLVVMSRTKDWSIVSVSSDSRER